MQTNAAVVPRLARQRTLRRDNARQLRLRFFRQSRLEAGPAARQLRTLIIPSLVLFAHVPIKLAVGTSLLIISTNAFIGFMGDLHNDFQIDYLFLLTFCTFSIAGIIIGSNVARYIPSEKLKPLFGWFILLMGLYILIRELFY